MPQFAAGFLLPEGDTAAFVESGTSHSLPAFLEALADAGLAPSQVAYLIVTHAHLDHAGGASALMRALPNARLLAHPRAARHLIDPTRLVRSARAVYGDAIFAQLYGEILPIEASRVDAIEDGRKIRLGSRELTFFHTRGHANHHFCIHDSRSNGVFTGDAFGVAYPALQTSGTFVFPSTSPTDFDPGEARISIDKILATGADRVYLTHFGELRDLTAAAGQLRRALDFSEGLLHEAVRSPESDPALDAFCRKRLGEFFPAWFERETGRRLTGEQSDIIRMDLELNAAGIATVARKLRHPEARSSEPSITKP
jgi:glyoxylase-like metal-dependent hydrolase (beta-lactamase superfamily II)